MVQVKKDVPQATVFIVDDESDMRGLLRQIIMRADFHVKTYPSAQAFLKDWDPAQPGCLVLDIRMPEMDGLQLQELLIKEDCPLPIIFISAQGTVPEAVDALQHGAVDFLMKPFDNQTLVERVQNSIKLDQERREIAQQKTEIARRMAQLTSRERQVMDLIIIGKMNKVIAAELEISIKTVEVHRARVMEKLKIKNLPELIRLANLLQNLEEKSTYSFDRRPTTGKDRVYMSSGEFKRR